MIVTVKNAAGAPVHGAAVKIATSMPTMSMKGADIIVREHGNGTYIANPKLGHATKWAFDISATANGQQGTTHLERDFK